MLSILAVLIGATKIWRGRNTTVTNAASLRPALKLIDQQILMLGLVMLTALMPAVERSSTSWTSAAFAIEGVFALALFGVRARWRTRLFLVWETSVQSTIVRSLMPAPAPVHVMPVPAAAFDLRDAA